MLTIGSSFPPPSNPKKTLSGVMQPKHKSTISGFPQHSAMPLFRGETQSTTTSRWNCGTFCTRFWKQGRTSRAKAWSWDTCTPTTLFSVRTEK